MRNRKWIVFAGCAAVTMFAVTVSSGSAARAEDFCAIDFGMGGKVDALEKEARLKCKVGDVIHVPFWDLAGRLCDFHTPIAPSGLNLCVLAPPRKTY